MPGLFGGFGNYFVVIFQGSQEVVYPRVNNLSILILLFSYLLLILSLISEFGGGTGWTLYPPLSTSFMSLSPSSTGNLIFGLLVSGISSCLTCLNFWVTILNLRSYCLTLKTMPLFPWALFITAAMLLLTLPILSGALLLVLAASQRIFFQSLVKNCNHKRLGVYYLLSAFIFGISGTLISVLMRIELYSSGNRIISPENQNFYNVSISLHGLLMIFFLVMPGLFGGFGNYFAPIFLGSPEVVYPRVNNFSILVLFLSYLFLILSSISEFGGGTGWTLYPPLSTSFMSLS